MNQSKEGDVNKIQQGKAKQSKAPPPPPTTPPTTSNKQQQRPPYD
jgi:hypothetical protein